MIWTSGAECPDGVQFVDKVAGAVWSIEAYDKGTTSEVLMRRLMECPAGKWKEGQKTEGGCVWLCVFGIRQTEIDENWVCIKLMSRVCACSQPRKSAVRSMCALSGNE